MPKVKDAKTGKTYTSHWQTSPRHYMKETCQQCHSQWSDKQIAYVIDSLKNRYDGKVRKAEFWLTRLVDKFEEAQNMGVEGPVLADARKAHDEAHLNWEWWTAANGAYFHNPEQANDSLNKSMIASQNGIKLLDEAMGKKRGTGNTQTVAPAPPQPPQKAPVQ
jgi:formate-dependent nitrite reductase cytochrome c552 subunit